MNTQNPFRNGLSRRDFLKIMGASSAGMALLSTLPAFAQDATAAATMAVNTSVSGDINYWHHFTSDQEFEALEAIMALFAQAYPNVKLTQENIPNADFMAKFTAAVAADSRPDTTMISQDRFADMIGMNGLVDLTDRINSWDLKPTFPDSTWTGVTADGKIYGVPAFTFVNWMYYRKDWFEEAGIAEPPKTLEDFRQVAIKLTDASKNRYGFGLRGGGGGQGFLVDLLQAFGSPLIDADGKASIDRDKAIEAIKFYSGLFTTDKVVPPSAPGDSFRQIMEAFKTGQTAMIWHHTGSLADLQATLGDKLGTAVMPTGPVGNLSDVSYLYNGVMKEDHMDAAWAWISFWGQPDPAIALLEKTGYFPASSAVTNDPRITGNPLYTAAIESVKIGHLPPSFVGLPDWSANVLLPAFQKVLVGDATVEAAVDEIIDGLNKAIA